MTGFARALRTAGVPANRTRLATSIAALAEIDPLDVDEVYWATRLTLCSEPDDLPRFDAAFGQWFRGSAPALPALALRPPTAGLAQVRPLAAETGGDGEDDDDVLAAAASDLEILRRHDIAELSEQEREEVDRMIAVLAPRVATRRTLRWAPRGREHIDVRRTVRQLLHDGGEPGALRYDHRRAKPRRLVLLLDVNGSMAPYADVLLRFAHAAVRVAPATSEVFTVSTRLTRITRQLRIRDPDLALRAAGAAVPDWSGGTLLGETLRAFLDRWGQRGTARRAVVVIASDGWERGDAALLGEQAARLARLAHAVIWVNPHKGKSGFASEAVTAGRPHDAAVADLIAYLAEEVLPHAMAEEETIYPAAVAARGDLADTVNEMAAEHGTLSAAAEALAGLPDGTAVAGQARQIADLFAAHAAKENEMLLPALLANDDTDLAALLAQMHRHAEEAAKTGRTRKTTARDPQGALLGLLLEAARALTRAGQADQACRLAAAAWAAVREDRPDLAVTVTVALHGLTRRVGAAPTEDGRPALAGRTGFAQR